MDSDEQRPTPLASQLPGGWIETPADRCRQHSYIGSGNDVEDDGSVTPLAHNGGRNGGFISYHSNSQGVGSLSESNPTTAVPSPETGRTPDANEHPAVLDMPEPTKQYQAIARENASIPPRNNDFEKETAGQSRKEEVVGLDDNSSDSDKDEVGGFAPIRSTESENRPPLQRKGSKQRTEDDLFRALSRRKTNQSNGLGRTVTASSAEEDDEINNLMSKMFGKTRQASSEEEKTRHYGVVYKHLTVKGMGVGAALQPSVGDLFLDFPRFIKNLLVKGPRKAAGKPPVRTILDDFSGCIKPGEMLLVLGRPGAGCSTFLKMIGNQRFGFEEITGDVAYGGTDAKEMSKKYRSEVLYNPEDDLHYATLKVKGMYISIRIYIGLCSYFQIL